jgi:hypothetical protein
VRAQAHSDTLCLACSANPPPHYWSEDFKLEITVLRLEVT